MVLKFILLIILLNLRNVILETSEQENLVGVSTTNTECSRKAEIIDALNQTTSRLESVKDEIVAKIETLKNKMKNSEAKQEDLEKELSLYRNRSTPSRDCKDVQRKGYGTSGIYRIRPRKADENFAVWCDMTTRGGGWTYVLNRFDGSQDFSKNWADYKQGFGELSGEHWLGLEHLHHLTNSRSYELLIELIDWNSTRVHATYDDFEIENESKGYKISSLGSYEGDAGDAFKGHKGNKFSTADRDQDMYQFNCAENSESGWWFGYCYDCLLTGTYVRDPVPDTKYKSAIQWNVFRGFDYILKEARMMIRPSDE